MLETIQAIALLCMVSAGGETAGLGWVHNVVDRKQLECQKYYVKCVENKDLAKCVLERKAD